VISETRATITGRHFRVVTYINGLRCNVSRSVCYLPPQPPDGPSMQLTLASSPHQAAIRARWTPPANALSQNQLRYEAQVQAAEGAIEAGEWTSVCHTAECTALIDGLVMGSEYRVRVVPFSSYGVGEPCPVAHTRTNRRSVKQQQGASPPSAALVASCFRAFRRSLPEALPLRGKPTLTRHRPSTSRRCSRRALGRRRATSLSWRHASGPQPCSPEAQPR
jgi:hypothetical protein